jgi:transposase
VPTYGHHASVGLFGAVDIRGGQVAVQQAADLTAQTFQGFLEELFARYPGRRLVLICDNAKIHHAKLLAPFWEAHRDRVTVWYLPAYSPNLNVTERLWKWLKETVIVNAFHPDVAAIAASVQQFLDYLPTVPEDVRSRLCG